MTRQRHPDKKDVTRWHYACLLLLLFGCLATIGMIGRPEGKTPKAFIVYIQPTKSGQPRKVIIRATTATAATLIVTSRFQTEQSFLNALPIEQVSETILAVEYVP